jgi:hypothetical protein
MVNHIVVKTFKERKEKGEFTGRYSKQSKIKIDQSTAILKLFKEL